MALERFQKLTDRMPAEIRNAKSIILDLELKETRYAFFSKDIKASLWFALGMFPLWYLFYLIASASSHTESFRIFAFGTFVGNLSFFVLELFFAPSNEKIIEELIQNFGKKSPFGIRLFAWLGVFSLAPFWLYKLLSLQDYLKSQKKPVELSDERIPDLKKIFLGIEAWDQGARQLNRLIDRVQTSLIEEKMILEVVEIYREREQALLRLVEYAKRQMADGELGTLPVGSHQDSFDLLDAQLSAIAQEKEQAEELVHRLLAHEEILRST